MITGPFDTGGHYYAMHFDPPQAVEIGFRFFKPSELAWVGKCHSKKTNAESLLNHNSAIHCPIVLKFGTLMHMCPTSVQAEIG